MAEQNEQNQAATFTQADVDRIVGERLARAKSGNTPDEAEMAEFRKWKAEQPTQAQRDSESAAALAKAKAEIAQLKAQAKISNAECKPEFAEFVTAQVLAMGEDVDKNLKDYKKDHPQYFGKTVVVKKGSAMKLTGGDGTGSVSTNEMMNELLRNRGRVNET